MIGTKIGDRYEIVAELGRGGMGAVYRAWDPRLGREVAVKLIPPALFSEKAEERFRREAQVVAQLDHPCIAPIFDIGTHDGSIYYLMPVIPGVSLRVFLREQLRSLKDLLEIGVQVAEALDYSHVRGVIHRDVKPENIMISIEDARPRVRIMDFGLARTTEDGRITNAGSLVGTTYYFSPEQLGGREVDGRTDIYSLGTVLYECVAGQPPFTGDVQSVLYRIAHEIPPSLRGLGALIPPELEEIIMRSLAKDPAKRYQRASEVAVALSRFRSRLGRDEQEKAFQISKEITAQHALPLGSQFIGREKELTAVQRRLHAALEGECQFVLIGGEPGIGKTRLLEEVEHIARARRIRVLHGRFIEQDRTFPYQGFVEVLQDYFRLHESRSSHDSPDFSDLAPELASLFPALSEISALRTTPHSTPAGDLRRTDDRTYVYELIARTLTRLAAGAPLMLVFENLHAAETSLDALSYLVRRLGATPTLITATYRQTEIDRRHPLTRMIENFGDDPRFESFVLGPLSPSEHRAFVQSMVGEGRLSDTMAQTLYESTEANPFFTRELVRSMTDGGGISRAETGEWVLSRQFATAAESVPETIQQTIERRIEKLVPELREVLSVASVIGRSFEFEELQLLLDDRSGLDDAVDLLVREGFLEEQRSRGSDRLAFTSGIVRDVLYGALSRRKRRGLHRRYAELLEANHEGRLERVYPELVHHMSEGDVPDRTIRYGLALAKWSLGAYMPERAVQAARTVLEFLEEDEPTHAQSLGEARMVLASGQRMFGKFDAALRDAEESVKAFERAGMTGQTAEAMLLAAEIAWQGRQAEETRRWVARGIELARASQDRSTLVQLLTLALTVSSLRGEHESARQIQEELRALEAPAPGQETAEPAPAGGTLLVGLVNPIAAEEPCMIMINDEVEVLSLVFDSLFETDELGYPRPLLCRNWEVLEQGRLLRFDLRPDVKFHDGTILTARCVKESFEHAIKSSPRDMLAAHGAVDGAVALREGRAEEAAGIVVRGEHELEIRLTEPLPFYPAMLADPSTGITRRNQAGEVVGTGPFRIVSRSPDGVRLEAVRDGERGPRLDGIRFTALQGAAEMADRMRNGSIDVGRDFSPHDFESVLREPHLRDGYVEATKKNTYLAVFNTFSPAGSNEALRQAMCGVVQTSDLVWRSLGRLAQPASGLIPPGIFGHDAGLRRKALTRERAMELIAGCGLPTPIPLVAAAHPLFHDRYRTLLAALLELWRDIGVELTFTATSMQEFIASATDNAGIDLRIGRWVADYDDPDSFAYGLFNSRGGVFARYYCSDDLDELMIGARRENRPAVREALYHRFESVLARSDAVLPLFHEIDYRVFGPRVRGLRLRSSPPYVNYETLNLSEERRASETVTAAGGILTVAITEDVAEIIPARSHTVERAEVAGTIFETLTRCAEGARIEPWLASEIRAEDGGARFRVRLRDVRFQDGRRLTARDVRYSWERLLQDPVANAQWLLAPIRGAVAVIEGKSKELSGFRFVTPREFVVEIESPVSFFPALVAHPSTAILPEGVDRLGDSWRNGCVGTGPFRLIRFEPGRLAELERNPLYWRTGYPRSEGVVFRLGTSPVEVKDEFMAGRLSMASELLPSAVEDLIRDPAYAACYREVPRLSIYFMAFNARSGPLSDREVRRALIRSIDVPSIVRRKIGRLASPAHGIIPPGLIGHSAEPPRLSAEDHHEKIDVPLEVNVHPMYLGQYALPTAEIFSALRTTGAKLRLTDRSIKEFLEVQANASADINMSRWIADYPDTDTFVHGLLHQRGGIIGRYCGSDEIDALIDQARAELDPAVRHVIYRKVEEIIVREALLLPLFHEQVYRFKRPEVEGLRFSGSLPEIRYEYLHLRG